MSVVLLLLTFAVAHTKGSFNSVGWEGAQETKRGREISIDFARSKAPWGQEGREGSHGESEASLLNGGAEK